MAPIPPNVAAARQQVLSSDFFALCYLMLCQLAYANENSGPVAVGQITQMLPTLPVPQGNVQGKWSLSWGPYATPNNSNLMYAAEFSDSLSGLPVFSAIVIRGTDTQAKPSGILEQVLQDVNATSQVVFPVGNQAGARIAQGTWSGLQLLSSLPDPVTHKTVVAYAQGFVANNPDAPVVVTGHSLGGCQTTVLALDLASKLPAGAKIIPNSFAAPTAGNAAFIQLYENRFPFCPRWFNDIDLVPMAYAGVSGIAGLWKQCQRPAPLIVAVVAAALAVILKHLGYTQQSAANSRMLSGACQGGAAVALPEAVVNQAVTDIRALLGQVAPKLQAAASPLVNVAEKLLSDLPFIGGGIGLITAKITVESFDNLEDWVKELLFQHLVLTGYWNAVEKSQGVAFVPNPFGAAAAAGANP